MSKVHNVVNHFDLHDYTSTILEAYLAAQVAQSTAWRIDTMITSAARTLFKNIRQELFEQGVDAMAELTIALTTAEYAETSFAEIGFTQNGPIETIRALNAQRDQWHDLAETLTSLTSDYNAVPRTYRVPTLESAFFDKKQMKVGADTQRRLRISATRMATAYDTPEAADELFKRKVARQQTQLDSMSESMHNQAGAVFLMFNLALRSDEEGASMRSKNFCALPLDSQRALLTNAIAAADRTEERAAGERSISEGEFDRISLCSIKLTKEVTAALKSPKFVIDQRVTDSVEAQPQRHYRSAAETQKLRDEMEEAAF